MSEIKLAYLTNGEITRVSDEVRFVDGSFLIPEDTESFIFKDDDVSILATLTDGEWKCELEDTVDVIEEAQEEIVNYIEDVEEFYITGLPIKTDIGMIRFITVKEYPTLSMKLGVLQTDKNRIICEFAKGLEKAKNEEDRVNLQQFIDEVAKAPFYEIVREFDELNEGYRELFDELFYEDGAWDKVTVDSFDYYRDLMIKMNGISVPETNPNPEIQKWIDKSNRVKQQNNQDGLDFASMFSSLFVIGHSYEAINNLTMYQFYMAFQRLAKFKEYDSSTLFATVAPDVKVENWFKTIKLNEKESSFMSKDDFGKKYGGMLKD